MSGLEIATTTQHQARAIMGQNFLGIEEVCDIYKEAVTNKHITSLAAIPFSEATLNILGHTHVLVAGCPVTILDMRNRLPRYPKLFDADVNAWYNKQPFASTTIVRPQWYLMRKHVIVNSTMKPFDQQRSMLITGECVPRACEVVYATLLHFLVTGERLFERTNTRCIDADSDGERIYVGHFDYRGLRINNGTREANPREDIGITSLLRPV